MKQYAVLLGVQKPVPHFRLLGVFPSYEAAQRHADRIKNPASLWWGSLRNAKSMMRQGERRLEAEERRLDREMRTVHRLLYEASQAFVPPIPSVLLRGCLQTRARRASRTR